ncbi:MAG: aminotransferase class V-fold PLP-dependent enzyme [Chloroflexota bacterium]
MKLSDIRRLTPVCESHAYFQTSGFSPKTTAVLEETIRWMHLQNQGPALPWISSQVLEMFEDTREKVGQSINADAEEIVLGENVTIGINIVANGIDWQPGDGVILSNEEHPGNRIPWYNFVDRYGIELRYPTMVNDEAQFLADFERQFDDKTRLVAISHVGRETGVRLPVKKMTEIAHQHDVPILLDGAQSYGAIPIDVKDINCDFYTFSGHKYIMAPQGTGACYVRQDRVDWLKPSWIGSHSQETMDKDGGMTLHPGARRFEFGTRNLADQAGFRKALEIWETIGWETVFSYIATYTDRMKAELQEVPNLIVETPLTYEKSAGIVTFRIPEFEAYALSASLLEHEQILVAPAGNTPESIRVSTHVFNTDEEIDRLVSGLCRIVKA